MRRSLVLCVASALLLSCRSAPAPEFDPAERTAPEPDLVVAAWADPATLPPEGGQTRIRVRVQQKGGRPYVKTRVRLRTRFGTLRSGGETLLTDANGLVQDSLATKRSTTVDVYTRGTRYRIRVVVAKPPASP